MFFDGSRPGSGGGGRCLSYAALIVFLRVSGARTLSKLNAFDLAVTKVALGPTLATSLLSSEVSLAEGVLAISLLILLQFVVAWALVRWRRVRDRQGETGSAGAPRPDQQERRTPTLPDSG